ncbi:hypothetical protein [Soonwooa sp.]|uniref:hypothetical protein n=1 Tax=Soonwooa sp. TaxID=1938592 RepID=UPI002603E9C4|nr:hypothetical protein [Soonwooa sp.]
MKTWNLQRQFVKSLTVLCLSFGIVMASCGIKIALTQSLNIENYCGQSLKSIGSCTFTALENKQEKVSIQQKKTEDFSFAVFSKNLFQENLQQKTSRTDFPLSRSVPLYILYQQQRDALLS